MKTVLIAAIGVLLPLSASAALSGPWIVKADLGPKMRFSLLCAVSSAGAAISGPCYPVLGRPLAAQGSLAGRKLSFKYFTTYNGSGLQLDFRGTLQADGSVTGPVTNRLGEGTFQAPAPTAVDDRTRLWTISAEFPGIPAYTVVCVFTQTGEKIAGPCVIPQGDSLNIAGASDGTKITFDYDTKFQNQPIHAHYDGRMSGASTSGTIKAGDSTGTFTAKAP